MVDKADISSTLPGKNGPSKSKSYKNEGTLKRKKNLKRSQNSDIEDEIVDEHGIHEGKKDVELEPSTWSDDKEKEMVKNEENLIESLNGEKHISIKNQTDKSGGFVADGSGCASLQTTPKWESEICNS